MKPNQPNQLDNPERLICNKTQPNETKPTQTQSN